MTDVPVLRQLGDWLSQASIDDLPESARRTAKRSILDAIGVALAAYDTDLAAVIRKTLDSQAGPGPCTVLGSAGHHSAEMAAFANASLGHALDFDDVSHPLGGHPTVQVLPTALALLEQVGGSGAQLLLAYAVGVEVETAIGRGVNFTHYDKGWHPTATIGTFGSAAAAAKVLGLDASAATSALSLATSFAAGIKAGFGTMAKPLQVGRSAQSGVMCGVLAQAGATAKEDAFEAKQGFAMVFNGEGTFNLGAITADLGRPWDLTDPGIAIKLHACCGGTHSAVDAAIELHRQLGSPTDIVSVDVAVHPRRFAHLNRPDIGADPFEAKFSLQYSVALALLFGQIRMNHFQPEALSNPDLVALAGKIHARPMRPDECGPEHFAGQVRVESTDGRSFFARWERPRGRTPETALQDSDIEQKFRGCVDGVLSASAADSVLDAVASLETLDDMGSLTALLRAESKR